MDALSHDTPSHPSLNQGAALLFKRNKNTLRQRLMHEIITIFFHKSYIQNGPQPVRPPISTQVKVKARFSCASSVAGRTHASGSVEESGPRGDGAGSGDVGRPGLQAPAIGGGGRTFRPRSSASFPWQLPRPLPPVCGVPSAAFQKAGP